MAHINSNSDRQIKPEPFIPLSSDMKAKLENSDCNFSLYSPRMVSWNFVKDKSENKKEKYKLEVDKSVIKSLCEQSKKSFPKTSGFLKKKNELQKAYISELDSQGIKTFDFKAKSSSPFITGLGSGHPTETGMILDRNTGLPYIPASSIKGVLRLACAIDLAKKKYLDGNVPDDDEKLVRYFGSENDKNPKRGQLIILDAYPESVPSLKVDIMNPHFGNYYSGTNKQPVETETPVPIKFLTVKEGAMFVFRCAFMPLGNEILSENERQEIQQDVDAMFDTAFEAVGFGGKTAIGYGRFKKIDTGAPTK